MIRAFAVSAFGVWLANQHVNPEISPCVAEDGPGPCYWDARTRDNGLGRSFLIDTEGNVSYR